MIITFQTTKSFKSIDYIQPKTHVFHPRADFLHNNRPAPANVYIAEFNNQNQLRAALLFDEDIHRIRAKGQPWKGHTMDGTRRRLRRFGRNWYFHIRRRVVFIFAREKWRIVSSEKSAGTASTGKLEFSFETRPYNSFY